jgi:flavin-dependent dehydrogenase
MQQFDVVIVGAGPAGGQCARRLAQAGYRVLLAERYSSFVVNSFSSAGMPLAPLEQFQLPNWVVGSEWRKLAIVTSQAKGVWTAPNPVGVVLDFAKLRQFLAQAVQAAGGEVWLGCFYMHHQTTGDRTQVSFKCSGSDTPVTVETRILVDATGSARAVMYAKGDHQPDFLTGTGIEYLIEVSDRTYYTYAQTLTFLLGYRWMPKGYAWIFPMQPNQLKVGVGWLNAQHTTVKPTHPLNHYLKQLIQDYLHLEDYHVLDRHGSTLRYSRGLQDIYFKGNVVAIGDAVSTVNFLGGEGIRHGMLSADIAAVHIQRYLSGNSTDFAAYRQELHHIFLKDWKRSEALAMKKYLQDSDQLVDKVVAYLQPFSLEDVVDILFYYRFERLSKGLPTYLWRKLTSLLGQWRSP